MELDKLVAKTIAESPELLELLKGKINEALKEVSVTESFESAIGIAVDEALQSIDLASMIAPPLEDALEAYVERLFSVKLIKAEPTKPAKEVHGKI